jgi:hypothetical protein
MAVLSLSVAFSSSEKQRLYNEAWRVVHQAAAMSAAPGAAGEIDLAWIDKQIENAGFAAVVQLESPQVLALLRLAREAAVARGARG